MKLFHNTGIEGTGKVKKSQCHDFAIIHWWWNIIVDFKKGSFSREKFPLCRLIMIGIVWTICVLIQMACHNFGKKTKIRQRPVIFHVILIETGIFE